MEDLGSPQPSPGRVREGCLQAVALGEPGVTQVGVGESIWAGAGHQRSKRVEVDAYVWGRGAIKESGLPWGWPWTSRRPQGPGQGSGEASWPQGRVLRP